MPKNSPRQALRGEVDHPDGASGSADAQQLVGHGLVIRGKDRAGGRGDDVEVAVGEGERLSVRLDPLELDSHGGRFATAGVEVLGRQVRRDDPRPSLCGADGDVSRSRSDVKHTLSRGDRACRHELRSPSPHRLLGKPVVVAKRPHRALGGLELSILKNGGIGHVRSHLLDSSECRHLQQRLWHRDALHCPNVDPAARADFAQAGHRSAGRDIARTG
jgi:hypothetical protein